MKRMKKKLSLVLVLALLVGMFGNVVAASAATKSSWSFKTKSGLTIEVDETLNMQKNEFQDFNLYKSGKEITQKDSRYTVTWSSSDKNVVWVDSSNGKARADKFGKLSDEYVEATVTAKIKNKTTGAVAYRRFKVSVGTPEPEGPTVDHITLRFKDGTDPAQALKIDQTYTLETLVYDTEDGLISAEEASLYFKYFCDKAGVTISGSTIKPTKDGEYTITVGAFETEAEAKAATSAGSALFTAELKNLVVEANKPKINEIRQVDLYTVALTFNKAEYAKALTANSSLLTVTYDISGYQYNTDFSELLIDEKDPSTVLVSLYSGLTEGVTYTFTYKSTDTITASVTGSGTKPAQIVLESGQVEVEREYYFEVKILNNKGVDITDTVAYTCTFEDINSDFASSYILESNYIYFFEEGKSAVIRAKLDLGYDDYGNPIQPIYSNTARFVSIPKAKPIIGSINGSALVSEDVAPDSLTYTTAAKTICMDDFNYYVYVTFPYIDEFRETHTRYIVKGQDTTDGTVYSYKSSNPNVLEVNELDGSLYPFAKGVASVYLLDETGKAVGAVNISVTDKRALTSFTITNQSSTKLSADGNPQQDEVITLKLNAKDQLGTKVDANYTFTMPGIDNYDFDSLFNHEFDEKTNTLKIWEGGSLLDALNKTQLRRFTIEVTAEYEGKTLPPQKFFITVKDVTKPGTTTSKLVISNTNIDLKLNKDSLDDYKSIIQVVTTDSSGYYISKENVQLIDNATKALTAENKYSLLILYKNGDASDYVSITNTNGTVTLNPITENGNELEKTKNLGTYTVRLYKGNGTKAQPIANGSIVLSDSTQNVAVSVKTKNINNTDPDTIKKALNIKRGNTDISSYVDRIVVAKDRQVNNTYQISELILYIKVKELNPDWPSDTNVTEVTLTGLNLQFKQTN